MHNPADPRLWQGREDKEAGDALRWHQRITPWNGGDDLANATTLLGFACDEGVQRNQGRSGAHKGPAEIRRALANCAYFQKASSYDAGDVVCSNQDLEQAHRMLVTQVSHILHRNGHAIILGGGHEMAWGNYLGLADYLQTTAPERRIGIINFDAHFDLRSPAPHATSGTPFRQIAEWCDDNIRAFNYMVLGINPAANTSALFDYAKQRRIKWHNDVDCTLDNIKHLKRSMKTFLEKIDELYLTICMDVFPAHSAPGVSAPSALGVDPIVVIKLIQWLKSLCESHAITWRLSDIAEVNPVYDIDNRTSKLAARLIHELTAPQTT
ncbi:formimidoylglutamase [Pseudomonadota bacterium]